MAPQPLKERSRKTRGQTSLDFLMTYGWAVLLVVAVVSSLFALGVFNAGSFLGPRATGFSQVGVVDWNINAAGVLALRLQNYAGMDISISGVEATHGPSVYLYGIDNVSIPNSKTSETFTVGAISSLVPGQYYALPLKIMYIDFDGFNYTETGTISGMVGAGVVSPSIRINSPSSNSLLNNRTINISISVWGANLSQTDIMVIDGSGTPVNVTTSSQLGTYSVLLDVQSDGIYNITALANYTDGDSASATASNITVNTTVISGLVYSFTVSPEVDIFSVANTTYMDRNYTLNNTGNQTLDIDCSSNASWATAITACPVTLAMGEAANITFRFDATGLPIGNQEVLLNFSSANATINATANVTVSLEASLCGTISSPGDYLLMGDASSPGTCFTIGADNVTLDCDGHNITGPGSSDNGIYNNGHSYVTVKNCVITRFNNGIDFENGANLGTISNNTLSSNGNSIGLWGSNNNTIANNTATDSGAGIAVFSSMYNLIINNNFSRDGFAGVHFNSCSDNTLANNTIDSDGYGVYLYASVRSTVANNTISRSSSFGLAPSNSATVYNNILNNTVNVIPGASNVWNTTLDCSPSITNIIGGNCIGGNYWATPTDIGFSQTCADSNTTDGICDSSFNYDCSNIDSLPLAAAGAEQNPTPLLGCGASITADTTFDSNMTCSSTAILICIGNVTLDCNGYTIAGTGYGSGVFAGGDNVTVRNCNITGFQTGIDFDGGSYGVIENNTVSLNSDNGVRLSTGSGSIIANNTLSSNGYGVGIWGSNNNTIANNTATDSGAGMAMFGSMYNLITNNDFSRDGFAGIHFNSCSNNTIANNTIDSNGYGAYLYASAFSTIANNTISRNSGFGLAPSDSSTAYNNILNNTVNVIPGASNLWNTTLDCGVPGANIIGGDCIGGNYWANPSGTGFSQTCADSNTTDGICDSSFNYDCSNIDSLPLAAAGAEQNPTPLLGCGAAITENTTLDANLTCASTAINICTDNVILDCNGHTIAGSNSGSGVFAGGDNVTVRNCNITGFQNGISFEGAGNGTIENNTVTSNSAGGINLVGSDCVIANNTVSLDGSSGIGISSGSNNTIIGNTAGPGSYIGIILFGGSHDNLITDNNASGNGMGIHFNSCFDNIISNNTVDSNGYGIYLYASTSNTVANNTVSLNSDFGLAPSDSATVYNNILNNTVNAAPGTSDVWNTTLDCSVPGANIIGGPCVGGNYWAQPDGYGFSENCSTNGSSNSSGICTSPYTIDGSNVDELPLTTNFTSVPGLEACGTGSTAGMASYWKFDDGSGDIAADSADSNNGALVNSPTWTAGEVNGSLSFDGASSNVDIPVSSNLDLTQNMTLMAWINRSGASGSYATIIGSKEDLVGTWEFLMRGDKIGFHIVDTVDFGSASTDLIPDQWYHVAVVRNGSSGSWNYTFYVNGNVDAADADGNVDGAEHQSYDFVSRNTDTLIGMGRNSGLPFNGLIDEVAIYNRSLTADEIQQFYQRGLSGQGYCG